MSVKNKHQKSLSSATADGDKTSALENQNCTMIQGEFLMIWITNRDYLINLVWVGVTTYFSAAAVAFLCRGTSAGAPHHANESQIYIEVEGYELETMLTEHTRFGRFLHQTVEAFADDIQELVYVAQILRENQGLLVLLVGGVCSMMMALVAGLENVNVPKALALSTALYGITTLLVARSARRIVIQNNHHKPKLTKADVRKMMEAVPKEEFVLDNDLDNCDVATIEDMLSHREQKCSSTETEKKKEAWKFHVVKG